VLRDSNHCLHNSLQQHKPAQLLFLPLLKAATIAAAKGYNSISSVTRNQKH
jgi:hypothetical protein